MKNKILAIGFIILVILYMNHEMIFQNLRPYGSDSVQGKARCYQIEEHFKKTGEIPFWNPHIFAGMPVYQRGPYDPTDMQYLAYWGPIALLAWIMMRTKSKTIICLCIADFFFEAIRWILYAVFMWQQ